MRPNYPAYCTSTYTGEERGSIKPVLTLGAGRSLLDYIKCSKKSVLDLMRCEIGWREGKTSSLLADKEGFM